MSRKESAAWSAKLLGGAIVGVVAAFLLGRVMLSQPVCPMCSEEPLLICEDAGVVRVIRLQRLKEGDEFRVAGLCKVTTRPIEMGGK